MNVSKASYGVIAIAGAALLQLAGTAQAQSAPATVFFTPSTAPAAAAAAKGEDRQVITVIEDGTTATITVVDGEVESASVDGKDVPNDRVRVRKDRYELLDAGGDVVATIHRLTTAGAGTVVQTSGDPLTTTRMLVTPDGQTRVRSRRGQAAAAIAPAAPAPPAAPLLARTYRAAGAEEQQTPKVMMGVNLADLDPSLCGHFGINAGEATMFSGVYQGLPASNAGIGVYDIVIRVNGDAPAGPDAVRRVLRKLDPGDPIKFTIIQHGQQKEVTVKVEAYSNERLAQAHMDSVNIVADAVSPAWRGMAGMDQEEMKRYMVEAERAAASGQNMDRIIGRFAPAPGQTIDPSVVPLLRLDEMRAREHQARSSAMDAARKAEEVAKALNERAAQMEKRSVELKERGDRNAELEKRLDRLERMLEKLLDEKGR